MTTTSTLIITDQDLVKPLSSEIGMDNKTPNQTFTWLLKSNALDKMQTHDLVIYVSNNQNTFIIKNRYGSHGVVCPVPTKPTIRERLRRIWRGYLGCLDGCHGV